MMESGPMQGPAVPRDEAAISRKRTAAIGVADDVLRILWSAINSHASGSEEQRIDGDEDYLLEQIKRARGEIAEWRPESD
jgi:hypothetical protein